jgi:hypothetical protein
MIDKQFFCCFDDRQLGKQFLFVLMIDTQFFSGNSCFGQAKKCSLQTSSSGATKNTSNNCPMEFNPEFIFEEYNDFTAPTSDYH